IDPMLAMAYHNKARTLEQADHLREAVEAYKAFIQHAPAQSAQEIVAAKRRIRELEGRLN
ncbi:MAG TPA: hypothetical protein VI584_02085, partial [Nitrospiria bacterium]|nr:hypothetical protein [Nitrospiria bacterium]